MDINLAKDIVINAGIELVKRGLIARTWGNVSQRADENTMVITPSGRDYLSLTRDDIVEVNINTLEYSGDLKPSSEKGIHAACYQNNNINFVIHTHQEYASIISACNLDSIEVDKEFSLLKGRVMCAPYGLPSTKGLCSNIKKVLPEAMGHCIIMKNHGALCFGKDYEETFEAATQLEDACKKYLEMKFSQTTAMSEYTEINLAKHFLGKHGITAYEIKPKKFNAQLKDNMVINDSIAATAYSYINASLKPMVDDFAQIVGVKMKVVNNSQKDMDRQLKKADAVFLKGCGAVCKGRDAEAVSMIVEKNCKANMWAEIISDVKPINPIESKLMRTVYKMKYSKQKDG